MTISEQLAKLYVTDNDIFYIEFASRKGIFYRLSPTDNYWCYGSDAGNVGNLKTYLESIEQEIPDGIGVEIHISKCVIVILPSTEYVYIMNGLKFNFDYATPRA